MMKLSRKAQILLAVGIVVVLAASLFMTYYQQDQEQSRLNQELDVAQLRLAQPSPEDFSSQQMELESRLAQIEPRLVAVKERLRQPIDSIEVTDTFFQVAETNEVEIIEIGIPGLGSEELDGGDYSVLLLTAVVEGDVSNLVDFVREVSRRFPTGILESVEILVPEVIEEEIEGEELAKPLANLSLLIYSYQGD